MGFEGGLLSEFVQGGGGAGQTDRVAGERREIRSRDGERSNSLASSSRRAIASATLTRPVGNERSITQPTKDRNPSNHQDSGLSDRSY